MDTAEAERFLARHFWSYVSASCVAELSPVTSEPGDEVGRELLKVFNSLAPEPHPDLSEFFQAMVDGERLVLRFRPDGFAGQV